MMRWTNELEGKVTKLQMADNDNANPEIKQEDVILMNDVITTPPSSMAVNYHPDEFSSSTNYPLQAESSSRTLIFDTKDFFPAKAQT